VRARLGRDARPVVGDRHPDLAAAAPLADPHLAAACDGGDRVLQEVREHLVQAVGIGVVLAPAAL
jgi:hypothetical protein